MMISLQSQPVFLFSLSLLISTCHFSSFVFLFKIPNDTPTTTTPKDRNFEFLTGSHRKYSNCEGCGIASRNRIIGGRDAHIHDFPWMVSLKYWDVNLCGGTLINSRYVITAAHCVSGKWPALLSVVISVVDILDTRLVSFRVTKIIAHSKFDKETFDYDIGLLRLARRINFAHQQWLRPVCLPLNGHTNKVATVVGWGVEKQADSSQSVSPKLHRVDLPVVSNRKCQNASGLTSYVITARMLCAGYLNGGKDACQGDSGGPLLIQENGMWQQIGIVSWGVGCAKPNYYGVYTRISLFIDWIRSNMNDWSC